MTALPFVDVHGLMVRADEDETWPAVVGYATALSRTGHGVLSRLLGTVPESGFTIVETRPHRELTERCRALPDDRSQPGRTVPVANPPEQLG